MPGGIGLGGAEEYARVELQQVSVFNLLGNDIAVSLREPHVDVDRRLNAARKAFFGHIQYFRSRAVHWHLKCKRYESIVQSTLLFGSEGLTWEKDSIHKIHVFECTCLLRRCRKPRPASLSWEVWRPARLHVVRKLFHDHGFHHCSTFIVSFVVAG
eukprot:2557354-Pyramimonas_sp.AAC.1